MRNSIFILILCLPATVIGQNIQIKDKIKFLALGDSYTIGQSVAVSGRWPLQLIDSIRAYGVEAFDVQIIATTGWRTDDLKTAITNAGLTNTFNLVSLLIGVNNYYQGKSVESYSPEFEDLLETAIALAGGDKSRVFVVSIPDYGYTPFGESNKNQISAGIDAYNFANKTVTDENEILYVNITDISRKGLAEPDLVANDGLHPSAKQYTEWVSRILTHMDLEESDEVVTGIGEHNTANLQLSPNPFTDAIILDNVPSDVKDITFTIFSVSGQLIITESRLGKNKMQFDVTGLAEGMYFVSVSGNQTTLLRAKLIRK